ncbi:MAG: ABC transporter permease [Chloroflexota bacterium]
MSEQTLSQIPRGVPVYDSSRRKLPILSELQEIWRYRDLIFLLVRRDVTARYKRSVLGIAWTMLNPLGMMIVLTIVFSQVFRVSIEGYPAFVLSGLIVWNFFSQVSSAVINSLVWGGDLFSRIYLPRSAFAFSAIGTGLVNLTLSLIPLLVVMMVIGVPLRPTLLLVPFAMLLLSLFTLGVGLLISTIGIYFADVVEMYVIVLLAWMYLTPVIYPLYILPESVQVFLRLNPMVYLVDIFRMFVFYGILPSASTTLVGIVVAVVTFFAGWLIFTEKSDEFAYRT